MPIGSIADFEKQWKALAHEIGKKIIEDPQIKRLKQRLDERGFLSLEEKSTFITIADRIKYELIYQLYGKHDTQGYQEFEKHWQEWLDAKTNGTAKALDKSEENSNHFMYGSTPDPESFLKEFKI